MIALVQAGLDAQRVDGDKGAESTDLLVIGGGPAGTTVANLMARRGWKVTLLEKDHHPRFHIGESLLPMNMPILESLGLMDQVADIGVVKMGADFTAPGCEYFRTYHFSRALGDSPASAFEVRRSEFDRLLFEQCRKSGATALEGVQVTHVKTGESLGAVVQAIEKDGGSRSWRARFVVDASGRDTFLSTRHGWKERNRRHVSAAVFGHFQGVSRREGADAGNISIYWFEHGWIWMIPLAGEVMSIGAVCRPEYLKSRTVPLDEFLLDTLRGVPTAWARMHQATAVQAARATGNFSYHSRIMSGRDFLLVGDAFAFVDPVFSSGVFLAMSGAQSSVPVIEAALRGQRLQQKWQAWRHSQRMRRGLRQFTWFIYRFNTPAMQALFNDPRNVFRVESAVISLLAGDVFALGRVRLHLFVFRCFYAVTWLKNWRRSMESRRLRLASLRSNAE